MTKDHVVAFLKQTIDMTPADCTRPNFSAVPHRRAERDLMAAKLKK